MKKSIYVVLSLPLLTSLIAVQSIADPVTIFNGFYVGAAGGLGNAQNKVTRNRSGAVATSNYSDSLRMSAWGAQGNLLVGYGQLLTASKIYLGLEASAGLANLQDTTFHNLGSTDENFSLKLQMKNSLGLAARIGTLFGQTLGYLKFGIVSSQWQSNSSAQLISGYTTSQSKKRLTGFEAGLGVTLPLAKQISLGGEYNWVTFQKFNHDHSMGGKNRLYHSIKPQTQSFFLRLTYKL